MGSRARTRTLLPRMRAPWHNLRVRKRNNVIHTFDGKKPELVAAHQSCGCDIVDIVNSSNSEILLRERGPQATISVIPFYANLKESAYLGRILAMNLVKPWLNQMTLSQETVRARGIRHAAKLPTQWLSYVTATHSSRNNAAFMFRLQIPWTNRLLSINRSSSLLLPHMALRISIL